jgi:hypothetical protein
MFCLSRRTAGTQGALWLLPTVNGLEEPAPNAHSFGRSFANPGLVDPSRPIGRSGSEDMRGCRHG